ncbi:MAG TPA: hypothetical protein PKY88_12730 [Anaerohalosphaeraceae bacterium]|nr:hypothetical protein [Anaerohalosphaeraceae bacterium]
MSKETPIQLDAKNARRHPLRNKIAIFLIAAASLAGCTSVRYDRLELTSMLNQRQFDELVLTLPDGAVLHIKGYQSEQAKALEAAIDALARGH